MTDLRLEWETVADDHEFGYVTRARVVGGWIIRLDREEWDREEGKLRAIAVALAFVPDPGGLWGKSLNG